MLNLRKTKIEIKDSILKLLREKGSADMDVLTSSFKLETGFKEAVIHEIMEDMVKVGLIEILDGRLRIKPEVPRGVEAT